MLIDVIPRTVILGSARAVDRDPMSQTARKQSAVKSSSVAPTELEMDLAQFRETRLAGRSIKSYLKQRHADRVSVWEDLVRNGNSDAKYFLSLALWVGVKDSPNEPAAFDRFHQLALKGHRFAQCSHGYMYASGTAVDEDLAKLVEIPEDASEESTASELSQFYLLTAATFERGVFGKQDTQAAERYRVLALDARSEKQ